MAVLLESSLHGAENSIREFHPSSSLLLAYMDECLQQFELRMVEFRKSCERILEYMQEEIDASELAEPYSEQIIEMPDTTIDGFASSEALCKAFTTADADCRCSNTILKYSLPYVVEHSGSGENEQSLDIDYKQQSSSVVTHPGVFRLTDVLTQSKTSLSDPSDLVPLPSPPLAPPWLHHSAHPEPINSPTPSKITSTTPKSLNGSHIVVDHGGFSTKPIATHFILDENSMLFNEQPNDVIDDNTMRNIGLYLKFEFPFELDFECFEKWKNKLRELQLVMRLATYLVANKMVLVSMYGKLEIDVTRIDQDYSFVPPGKLFLCCPNEITRTYGNTTTGYLIKGLAKIPIASFLFEDWLTKDFIVFKVALPKMTNEELRIMVTKTVARGIDKKDNCEERMGPSLERYFYYSGMCNSNTHYPKLDCKQQKKEGGTYPNMCYLFLTLNIIVIVVSGATNLEAASTKGWIRITIEKSFESIGGLTRCLKKFLFVLPFSNFVLNPLWSWIYICQVQLIFYKDSGMTGREDYFDNYDISQTQNVEYIFNYYRMFIGKGTGVTSSHVMILFATSVHANLELFEAAPKTVKMNSVSVLSACSQLRDEAYGCWIESNINIHCGIILDDQLATTLIELYARHGSCGEAKKLFRWFQKKDFEAHFTLLYLVTLDQVYKNSSLDLHADFSYMCGGFVLLEFVEFLHPLQSFERHVWNKIAVRSAHELIYSFCDGTHVLVALKLHTSLVLGWKSFTTLHAYEMGMRCGYAVRVLEFLISVRCLISMVEKLTSIILIEPIEQHHSYTTFTRLFTHSKVDGVALLDKVGSVWPKTHNKQEY